MKRNYIELMANIVNEPTKIDIATFLRVAIWKPNIKKDDEEKETKEYKTKFLDVSFFGDRKEMIDKMDLKVGQPVNIKGYLSIKQETIEGKNINVISIIGNSIEIIKIKKDKVEGSTQETETDKEK